MPRQATLEKMRKKAQRLSRPTPVELPSGKWRCQITVNGVRRDVIDDDPEVAHAKALALKKGLIREEREQKSFLTLSDAIALYSSSKEAALSPSTIRGYEIIRKNRFKSIMQRNIYSLDKRDVQAAVNDESKLVSAKTVYNAYGLIRPVLKEYGINVFGVRLPQRIKPNKKYLQPEDIGKLLEAAKGDSCEIEIIMAAWLGMRRSEIIGLCWDCVDFDKKSITIRRTVVPDKDHNWVLKEGAKNESSQRTISCPDYILDKLRDIQTPSSSGQIFRVHPDTLRKHIHRICKEAGITDTTVHGLRHTNAAVMKSLGVDDRHAMARGGWKTEATYKQTYSYVFDQAAQDADEQINSYFKKMHTEMHTEK